MVSPATRTRREAVKSTKSHAAIEEQEVQLEELGTESRT